VEYTAMVEQQ
jgi:hypothetical protein